MKVRSKSGKVYNLRPRANLKNADLSGLDLSRVDLEDANLQGANMVDTILRDANLRNSNLKKADLEGSDIQGTDFKGADVKNANFKDTVTDIDTDFEGAFNIEKAIKLVLKRRTSRRGFFGAIGKAYGVAKTDVKVQDDPNPFVGFPKKVDKKTVLRWLADIDDNMEPDLVYPDALSGEVYIRSKRHKVIHGRDFDNRFFVEFWDEKSNVVAFYYREGSSYVKDSTMSSAGNPFIGFPKSVSYEDALEWMMKIGWIEKMKRGIDSVGLPMTNIRMKNIEYTISLPANPKINPDSIEFTNNKRKIYVTYNFDKGRNKYIQVVENNEDVIARKEIQELEVRYDLKWSRYKKYDYGPKNAHVYDIDALDTNGRKVPNGDYDLISDTWDDRAGRNIANNVVVKNGKFVLEPTFAAIKESMGHDEHHRFIERLVYDRKKRVFVVSTGS